MTKKHLGLRPTGAPQYKVAKLLAYVIGGIVVLLPFHALLTTWLGSNTGHLDLVRIWKEILIVGMIPFVTWLILGNQELKDWFLHSSLIWLIRAYILLHLILGAWALASHQLNATALIYALIINLRFLIFFIVCYATAAYSDFLRLHWRWLLLGPAAIVIAFGLIQLALPTDFLRHFGYGPKTIPAFQTVDSDLNYQRIQSTLRGANPFGAYLVLIIPAFIICLRSFWRVAALIASSAALVYTYSRSAWLGVIAAIASLEDFRSRFSRKTKELIAIALAIVVLIGLGAYALRFNHTAQDALFHTSSQSVNVSSNSRRASAIKDGLIDVTLQPLGRGPGTAGPASFRNTGHMARIAENYYLQIGQEVGILGMFLFIAINILVAKDLWLKRQYLLPQLLLASLVGITLVNLVSHAWADDTLSLLWWGLAGIALAPVYKLPGKRVVK